MAIVSAPEPSGIGFGGNAAAESINEQRLWSKAVQVSKGIEHKGFFHKNGNTKYSNMLKIPREMPKNGKTQKMGNVRF
eukprot:4618248-Amphidinium_carterae.1